MDKTYEVIFPRDALPGVFAVGTIRRGQSAKVPAAEAVRLVDIKGLAFAEPADESAARAELAAIASPEPAALPPPLPAADAPTDAEEH